MKALKSLTLVFYLLCLSLAAEAELEAYPNDIPVTPNQTEAYNFEILSTLGYIDQSGRLIVDIIEGYKLHLALSVDTLEGRPVNGLSPAFDLIGTSELIPPGESTPFTSTDESGMLRFGVIAGNQGMDRLTVTFGENSATIHINIIGLKVNAMPEVPDLVDGLNWDQLMQTRLNLIDDKVHVNFPSSITARDGDVVKVSGFMMPMNSSLRQSHFLLTSSPPHCFFDIPGGPSGVIEVFSEEGIEASWNPIILEGKLELVHSPSMGIIYRLHQTQIME
jgi:hypothetical protein